MLKDEIFSPTSEKSVQNPLPGDKDGVMKEVLKDFPVLCFLLLCLLFCLCLGTSTTRSFFSPTALWLGGLSGFFCINGPISISSDWDFILKEKNRAGFLLSRLWIQQQSLFYPIPSICCYLALASEESWQAESQTFQHKSF